MQDIETNYKNALFNFQCNGANIDANNIFKDDIKNIHNKMSSTVFWNLADEYGVRNEVERLLNS